MSLEEQVLDLWNKYRSQGFKAQELGRLVFAKMKARGKNLARVIQILGSYGIKEFEEAKERLFWIAYQSDNERTIRALAGSDKRLENCKDDQEAEAVLIDRNVTLQDLQNFIIKSVQEGNSFPSDESDIAPELLIFLERATQEQQQKLFRHCIFVCDTTEKMLVLGKMIRTMLTGKDFITTKDFFNFSRLTTGVSWREIAPQVLLAFLYNVPGEFGMFYHYEAEDYVSETLHNPVNELSDEYRYFENVADPPLESEEDYLPPEHIMSEHRDEEEIFLEPEDESEEEDYVLQERTRLRKYDQKRAEIRKYNKARRVKHEAVWESFIKEVTVMLQGGTLPLREEWYDFYLNLLFNLDDVELFYRHYKVYPWLLDMFLHCYAAKQTISYILENEPARGLYNKFPPTAIFTERRKRVLDRLSAEEIREIIATEKEFYEQDVEELFAAANFPREVINDVRFYRDPIIMLQIVQEKDFHNAYGMAREVLREDTERSTKRLLSILVPKLSEEERRELLETAGNSSSPLPFYEILVEDYEGRRPFWLVLKPTKKLVREILQHDKTRVLADLLQENVPREMLLGALCKALWSTRTSTLETIFDYVRLKEDEMRTLLGCVIRSYETRSLDKILETGYYPELVVENIKFFRKIPFGIS